MSEDRSRPGSSRLDRALEELTVAAPPADLRARVLARIAAKDMARARRSIRWRVALPAAAAVAAVTWATVWWDGRPSDSPARPPAVAGVPSAPSAPTTSGREAPRVPVAPPVASSAARSVRRDRVGGGRSANAAVPVSVVATADDPPVLPPLTPPSPVQAAEITLTPIGQPAAIDVPGLRVDPLSPPDLNGSGLR